MAIKDKLGIRTFMIHITHYDPRWWAWKQTGAELPFDLGFAKEVAAECEQAGMNAIVIDIADGIEYPKHPELKRDYSVPHTQLIELCEHIRNHNMEVIPKLNFARSGHFDYHNQWLRPYSVWWKDPYPLDTPDYWKVAFEVIDEVLEMTNPETYVHIGMDEDKDRSYVQYADAIKTLHGKLAESNLRTVIWNDSCLDYPTGQMSKEKCVYAESRIPKDVVEVIWQYRTDTDENIKRCRDLGLDVWLAPGREKENVQGNAKTAIANTAAGMMFTSWIPCNPENREEIMNVIKIAGEVFEEE